MGQKRIPTNFRQIQKEGSQNKQRKSGKALVTKKTSDMIRLRQAVYELPPMKLYEYLLSNQDEESIDHTGEDDANSEDLLDLDSDMDISDEDEIQKIPKSQLYEHTGYLGKGIDFNEGVIFNPSTAYVITVVESAQKGFKCCFEAPDWFYKFRHSESGAFGYIEKLRRIIEEIASWFEETRQAFLSDPSQDTYALGDLSSTDHPSVLQSGLAEIINKRLSGLDIDKTIVSRLKNKIWLLWKKCNMPLESLFSIEFRMAWVVDKCLGSYIKNKIFIQNGLMYNNFTREDLKNAKMKNFESLDPEQRLRVLSDKVNLSNQMIETVYDEICSRIG
jgi:hypothetical protein